MKIETWDLLQRYKDLGWTIRGMVTSAEATIPENVAAQAFVANKPVIVPIGSRADLSPTQIRASLGIAPDTKLVSIHSGVLGTGFLPDVAGTIAKQFREAGVIVCNGGFPKTGLMQSVINGALSAEGNNLPPMVVVVTESLFQKDNLNGMYPAGHPIRILLIEDSQYLPNTMLRAHMLNSIADGVLTLAGAFGTCAEMFHHLERMDLNHRESPSPTLIANIWGFYKGLSAILRQQSKEGLLPPHENLQHAAMFTTNDKDRIRVATEVVDAMIQAIGAKAGVGRVTFLEQAMGPRRSKGRIATLAQLVS